MGQSTTHPGKPQPGQGIAENFGELLTPVGDWFADLFVFSGSSTEPVHRTGRVTSRTLIGRAAILAIFEIPSSGARFAALVTFNPRTNQYELALVDANSDMGLGVLVSEPQNLRAPVDVRVRFGKSATVIRDWTVVQTEASLSGTMVDVIIAVLPVAALEAGLTEGAAAAGVSMHIVEILVSPDRWVLQFFLTGSRGEILAAELVCTRIQPGCQPQLGCELGCAGLPGCAAGCEGFQPLAGVPVGQAPVMGQAQIMGQAECGCTAQGQAQPIGQVQTGCQTQLIGVSQLGCAQPLALSTPVVLAPQVCAPVQTCAPLQQCVRQPVPPPVQMGPQRPGQPGHPGGGHGGHK
ncbi:MAG TPA: hypothetical protein VHT91_31925 [Kofleriaceae bacterium]|jgi:hypothetical protein|nr:hypothetical protein [Kofleriaceae bacterium]